MVAFITVSQNPVIFKYSDVVLHHLVDFTVEWDTGDPAVKARLSRSLNGGAEAVLPGAPVRVGVMTQQIGLDQVLTFILRRASNAAEIGRVTVTTQKNALAQAMTDPDLGFIYGLKVQPLVDTIAVDFQTKQPAFPYVEIRRQDNGELVDSWMGGHLQQQHANVFSGFGRGLAQDTAFDMRIVALKDVGGGHVVLGSGAKNPEIKGSVTTGARTVTFVFDLIHVRTDGDPDGAGEFTFWFGVGDVATQQKLGSAPQWGEGDISAGGDREVARTVTIEHAPRRMWAQVLAWEDDTSFGDFLGHPLGLGFGEPTGTGYALPGSDSYEVDEGSAAWVTSHFDTDETTSDRQRGFEMSTGNFSIAYDVFGWFTVARRNGVNNFKGLALGRVPHRATVTDRLQLRSRALVPGHTQRVSLAAASGVLSISPEGSVLLRVTDPLAQAGYVTDLGGCFHGSVTIVSPKSDAVHVLGITHDGEAVVRSLAAEPAEGGWCQLGGTFTGAITAAARGDVVDVLAHDAEGHLFHRTLATHAPGCGSAHPGEWQRLGGDLAGPAVAIGTAGGDLAVLALARDGRILHQRLSPAGGWSPGDERWDELGRLGEAARDSLTIAVEWASEAALVVSAFDGDDLIGALLWHDYPHPDPEAKWVPALADPDVGVAARGCER